MGSLSMGYVWVTYRSMGVTNTAARHPGNSSGVSSSSPGCDTKEARSRSQQA